MNIFPTDLDISKNRLTKFGVTLSIVKGGTLLFETDSHTIFGFLQAIEVLSDDLAGSSVADKIVGKAVGLLCVYAQIKSLYASTLSNSAKEVLQQNKIYCEYGVLVDRILDRRGTNICPFEHIVAGISDPKRAFKKITLFFNNKNKVDSRSLSSF